MPKDCVRLCRNGLHPMVPENICIRNVRGKITNMCLACRRENWRQHSSNYYMKQKVTRSACSHGHPYVEGSYVMVRNGQGLLYRDCLQCRRGRNDTYQQAHSKGYATKQRELVRQAARSELPPSLRELYRLELAAYKERQAAKLEVGREMLERAKSGNWSLRELVGFTAPNEAATVPLHSGRGR